ncbi:MAG: hypothetical protein AB8G16_17640 [Gammaproteobacteria bacterium]
MIHNKNNRSCTNWLCGLTALMFFCLPQALAAPIQWVLQDVSFDDGGTAFGSFVFDADTNTFTSIAITTTDGSALSGSFYEFVNFEAGLLDADSVLLAADANPVFGTSAFNMNLAAPMTNAGGTIDLALAPPPFAFESTCLSDPCTSFFSIDRQIVSGSISAVPLPGAIWLFSMALGLLGGVKLRPVFRF